MGRARHRPAGRRRGLTRLSSPAAVLLDMDAGRAAGMTVAGLRGVEADVPIADLAELAQLLLRSSGVLAD
jgi:hypothetical protein